MISHLGAVIAVVLVSASPQDSCIADPSAPRLDHVVIVVNDLETAAARFVRSGFRIKQGRLHSNGLLNRHIKFRNGSEIELMTVMGEPRDRMAADYAELLRAGEGGVYVSLTVSGMAAPLQAATDLGLVALSGSSGQWSFLSFPSTSPAASVFFGTGTSSVQDPDSVLAHMPPVEALAEVWTEGGAELEALLERVGARSCGLATGPTGRIGTRWALREGALVVVRPKRGSRPRVHGAVLSSTDASQDVVYVHPKFWVQYR